MKRPALSITGAVCGLQILILISFSQAETAKQAIDALRSARGDATVDAIILMRGRNGQHQPGEWEVIANDPSHSGYRRMVVGNRRVLSDGATNRSLHNAPIALNALRIDSTEAFRAADAEARRVKVGFDSLDYELRSQPGNYKPMWVVVLRDVRGSQVGLIEVSGVSGEVMRRQWQNDAGKEASNTGRVQKQAAADKPANSNEADEAYREPSRPRVDYAKYENGGGPSRVDKQRRAMDNLWHRSTNGMEYAGEKVKNGFSEIGNSFADIFTGRATYRSTGKSRYTAKRKVGAGSRR